MSLLETLLQSRPSIQDRYAQIAPFLQQPQQNSLMDVAGGYGTPPGGGIFGNDQVDVLMPGDPRLRNIGGTQLARPAARSMREVLQSLGLMGSDIGGGYRSPEQQAALRAAKPGLAAPVGSSYHQEGLAIDLAAALQNARVFDALRQAGWNQLKGEPWHWTYGAYG